MKIETKYDVGQRFWIVYEHDREITCYIDTIEEIAFSSRGVVYFSAYNQDETLEDDIILEGDLEGLTAKILEYQKQIDAEEGGLDDI